MAVQIPRSPTTPRPEPAAHPVPHGPQPQPQPCRRPAPSPGEGAAVRCDAVGRERGGPEEAWIRGGPPLGKRAGANQSAFLIAAVDPGIGLRLKVVTAHIPSAVS
ncbi:hypothetical protein BAE44_0012156 [Dichanthelium oligosanthes]|uniref:Uncharacterized protein n=1 Tax=Dichanthelium oligosanthes TaxID=888268 RepID=A0A1E5VNW1_9POAL|nr:hypothetical protein BAE44_0012156 [Dichanthelium oligosanthes]